MSASQRLARPAKGTYTQGVRRVLVVDDEAAILTLLGLAFEEAGLTLEAAASTEEAIERLKTMAFESILVDKNLPGKSGIELVQWVRERNRTVPIVVMTGFSSAESARDALNLGIDRYIEKPFDVVMDVPVLLKALVSLDRQGWLPGQAERRATEPAGGVRRPRILLATRPENESALGDPLLAAMPERSKLERHSTLADLLTAVAAEPRPDIVVVDADLFPEIVPVIERLREVEEFVTIAVVVGYAPPLAILQQLIILGVTQLLDRNPEAYDGHVARVVRALGG